MPGVDADLRLHHEHLRSDEGGAWEIEEIEIVSGPTAASVQSAIARAGTADFAYVTFSGHGAQAAGVIAEHAGLCLADGSMMPTSALFPVAARSLIIVDACRDIIDDPGAQLTERLARHEGLLGMIDSDYRLRSRRMYDELVMAKGSGSVLVTACAAGQNAGDTSLGGAFTFSLMLSLVARFKIGTALSIASAVEYAGRCLADELARPQQTPEYHNGRSTLHFPFAVWPE